MVIRIFLLLFLSDLISQINIGGNSKVRTLETSIIPNKKDPEGSNLINGAANGIRLEPFYSDLAHYALHEIETMNNIKRFHYA